MHRFVIDNPYRTPCIIVFDVTILLNVAILISLAFLIYTNNRTKF